MDRTPLPGHAPFDEAEMRRRIAAQAAGCDYFGLLGLRLVDLQPGYARMELPHRRAFTHSGGVMQGGLLATLADACLAHATIAALDSATKRTTSIELKVNFIRPGLHGPFTAEARLAHLGSRTAVGDVDITDARGKLLARCLASLMILPSE